MNMKLLSADQLRYVTSRYPQLQGARLIPLSLVFLASAWWRAGGLHLPGDHLPYGPQAWFFAGLSVDEIASTLKISRATVKRDWATAKLWLRSRLLD